MDKWISLIASILSGLAVCIPLVYQLIKYVRSAAAESRWDDLLRLVIKNMTTAEGLFETGAERKEWVMGLLTANAASVGYDLKPEDVTKISKMIDDLCAMSKVVNADSEASDE